MKEDRRQPEGGLLQSREWMQVLRADGREWVVVTTRKKEFFGVKYTLPFVGQYIYFPRLYDLNDEFVTRVSNMAYGWARVDIAHGDDLERLQKCGKKVVQAPHDMQPKENLIIDITKSEEELLAQMKSKTRYNVRLAQKKGVKIIVSHEQEHIDAFYDLISATVNRKGLVPHPKAHYESILKKLPEDTVALYTAEYDSEVIAANIISFFNGTATYLHGATSDAHRNVMAPFLLQWRAMCDAKKRGCMWYDLGGVFPATDDPGKKGITRFKRGFAPKENFTTALGSYDVILSPWKYTLYKIGQKIHK
jgi:lipid II:glycine glycyltransferase (peptidoglycan interpeptide bridge formation enzyme)